MFVIIYLLLYFFLLCFYKTKSTHKAKTKSHTCTTKSQSAPSENIRSAEVLVLKHRTVLKFGLQYRLLSFFYFQFEK